jgi:hypothetical protein
MERSGSNNSRRISILDVILNVRGTKRFEGILQIRERLMTRKTYIIIRVMG